MESGAIRLEAMERALDDLIEAPERSANEVLAAYRPGPDDDAELASAVADAASRAEALAGKSADSVLRWAMGEVMPRFLGRVDPSRVRQRLIETLQLAGTEVA